MSIDGRRARAARGASHRRPAGGLLRRAAPTARSPRLAECDPALLGPDSSHPHVDRPVDARVEELVGSCRVVVAHGPPGAGTTHALARAARLLLGDHLLVLPHGPGEALAGLLDRAAREAGPTGEALVWLDDAPRAALHALATGLTPPPRVRLLATAREELLDADVTAGRPGRLPSVRVPAPAPGEPAGRRDADRDRLVDALCPRPRAGDRGPALREAVLRAALLRTAVDWDRLAVGRPLPRPTLLAIAADAVPAATGATRDELGGALDALLAGSTALLRARGWDGDPGSDRHHAPAPGLAAVADDLGPTGAGWELPTRLVEEIDARLPGVADRRSVGVLALHRHADDLALRLLADVDPTTIGAAAAYRAGLTALETGCADDARRWFVAVAATPTTPSTAADAAGYRPRAAFWLGLDPDLGLDERRERLTTVVAEGAAADRADAASVLAAIERQAGRAGARRHWLREAVDAARESGDTRRSADALVELAHLEWTGGSLEAARAAFTEAARCGDPECGAEAMMALGTLAAEQGDDETARAWYRRTGAGPAGRRSGGARGGRAEPASTEPALTVPSHSLPAVTVPVPAAPVPAPRDPVADGGLTARPPGPRHCAERKPVS